MSDAGKVLSCWEETTLITYLFSKMFTEDGIKQKCPGNKLATVAVPMGKCSPSGTLQQLHLRGFGPIPSALPAHSGLTTVQEVP